MNFRKGISPILATVIIIAVTLVIAIGVIGWIMGIWGGFGTTESLQIYPDSKLYDDGTIALHVKNTGSATATIKKVEVVGTQCSASGSWVLDAGDEGYLSSDNTVSPSETTISLGESCSLTAGATYQVKVYTDAGNIYSAVIRAESGS